ncbi:MAG: MATE family efflux transporter [Clostridia bacterium]|jgi:putative MATE family efflux protein|nr:MATE family efflux transporter [Clostridia bacterium]MCI2014765.1 MATE family efflux transporter [Clostridia bacterium]
MEEIVHENKMGTMPVNKLLLSMAVPMMISMIVQAVYNVVDSIYVAMLSENALTAVSLAFPMQNLMMAVASGIGVGTNALLSRALGEKKQNIADITAMQGVLLNTFGFLVFLIFGMFGSEAFIRSQTNIPEIVSNGAAYLRICSIMSFGIFAQLTFERLLQATGRTLCTMFTQSLGAIINIILDPILIFGLLGAPKMGVAGAAAATVTGQFIAGCVAFILNLKINKDINFKAKNIKPNMDIIKNILVIGIPSILMISIGSFMTYALNKILIAFTSTAVAVFGVYFKLQSFVFMPVFGLNNGMVPIIAYNYGAKKEERIHKTIKLSVIYAVCIMLLGLLCFQAIPDKLLLLFNASDSMLEIGIPALRIISLSFIFAGISVITSSVCQAFGFGIYSLLISVGRQLVVLVPAAYLLSKLGRLELVWLSFPVAEIVAMLLSILFIKKALYKVKKNMA